MSGYGPPPGSYYPPSDYQRGSLPPPSMYGDGAGPSRMQYPPPLPPPSLYRNDYPNYPPPPLPPVQQQQRYRDTPDDRFRNGNAPGSYQRPGGFVPASYPPPDGNQRRDTNYSQLRPPPPKAPPKDQVAKQKKKDPTKRSDDPPVLRVANVPDNTEADDIRILFDKYGGIVKVQMWKSTRLKNTNAYITFTDHAHLARILERYDDLIVSSRGIWARYRAKGGYRTHVNIPVGNEWFKYEAPTVAEWASPSAPVERSPDDVPSSSAAVDQEPASQGASVVNDPPTPPLSEAEPAADGAARPASVSGPSKGDGSSAAELSTGAEFASGTSDAADSVAGTPQDRKRRGSWTDEPTLPPAARRGLEGNENRQEAREPPTSSDAAVPARTPPIPHSASVSSSVNRTGADEPSTAKASETGPAESIEAGPSHPGPGRPISAPWSPAETSASANDLPASSKESAPSRRSLSPSGSNARARPDLTNQAASRADDKERLTSRYPPPTSAVRPPVEGRAVYERRSTAEPNAPARPAGASGSHLSAASLPTSRSSSAPYPHPPPPFLPGPNTDSDLIRRLSELETLLTGSRDQSSQIYHHLLGTESSLLTLASALVESQNGQRKAERERDEAVSWRHTVERRMGTVLGVLEHVGGRALREGVERGLEEGSHGEREVEGALSGLMDVDDWKGAGPAVIGWETVEGLVAEARRKGR